MPLSTASPRLFLLALTLPLALAACSGSSESSAARPASPSASASSSAAPTPSATLPIATSYVVTARAGVTDKDLKAAIPSLVKLHGVVGVQTYGPHRLRIDLTMDALPDNGKALFAALGKLGTISVPR